MRNDKREYMQFSISFPIELMKVIEDIAKREFTNRSTIIRNLVCAALEDKKDDTEKFNCRSRQCDF